MDGGVEVVGLGEAVGTWKNRGISHVRGIGTGACLFVWLRWPSGLALGFQINFANFQPTTINCQLLPVQARTSLGCGCGSMGGDPG